MKILHKLKFIFKILKTKEYDYNLMAWKSDCYDGMMKCVQITGEVNSEEVRHKGVIVSQFTKSIKMIVSVNIINMFKAAGYEFSDYVEFEINTKQDK